MALPKGSPWRDKISLAILDQQEKGTIQLLYDKWWKNTGEICSRDEKSKESKANALGTYSEVLFFYTIIVLIWVDFFFLSFDPSPFVSLICGPKINK